MAKHERFLVVDIGSTALHVGEFEVMPNQPLTLHAFDNLEYREALTDQNRIAVIGDGLRQILATGKYTCRNASLCVSGQAAFMRFVKLPPVTDDEASVRQIVEFEAKQNVPFPIEEVIWDYQLISREGDDEELEVMFAVIKNDIVEGVIDAVKGVGLKPQLVDFAPAALYNAARANYVGENECAMVLDIGGKCTNLLFLEGRRFFARSIPIAGASITQLIAKEFNISAEEAEILKRRYGFVALGGAYEEPESEVAATISKIIRNVMTRLHGEINRTINIYRSQQKGSKPVRLLLAGGSSTMAFTDHFFSEKLRMEVTYLNAFQVVNKSSGMDLEHLAQMAHLFPEIVGVALRHAYPCPVEISLTTRDIKSEGNIRRRVPFIWASCLVWVLILGICGLMNQYQVTVLTKQTKIEDDQNRALVELESDIGQANEQRKKSQKIYNEVKAVLDSRYQWAGFFNALQWAKPVDVWLVAIAGSEKPPEGAPSDDGGKKKTGDTKKLFGGGGGGGGGGSSSSSSSGPIPERIEWITLDGYSVSIPEIDPKADPPKPIRKIFTDGQLLHFEVAKNKRAATPAAKDPKAPAVNLDFYGDNLMQADTFLGKLFKESLAASDYFTGDVTLARYSDPSEAAKNMKSFRIVAKLKQPIVVKRP